MNRRASTTDCTSVKQIRERQWIRDLRCSLRNLIVALMQQIPGWSHLWSQVIASHFRYFAVTLSEGAAALLKGVIVHPSHTEAPLRAHRTTRCSWGYTHDKATFMRLNKTRNQWLLSTVANTKCCSEQRSGPKTLSPVTGHTHQANVAPPV